MEKGELREKELKEKYALPYSWKKLEAIALAPEYLQKGKQGLPYVKEIIKYTLEKIGGVQDPCLIDTVTDEKVLQLTVQNYFQRYVYGEGKQSIGDFVNDYKKTLDDYLGENKSEFEKDLAQFKEMTYLDFEEEKRKNENIVKSHEESKLFSEEEYKQAKAILEKYDSMFLLEFLRQKHSKNLMDIIGERVVKNNTNQYYAQRKKEAEKQEEKKAA